MLVYAVKRFVSLVITLVVASLIVFLVMEVLPGDPAQLMLGINAEPEAVAQLRLQLGLDRPLPVRYLRWVYGMLSGDFGTSYTYAVPVGELIRERLVVSLPLALFALFLSAGIAVPVGMIATMRHKRLTDLGIMGASQLAIAVPNFWFALLLVMLFSVQLDWLPPIGFTGWEAGLWSGLKSLILPTVALALPQTAILARVMRSSLLEEVHTDYMRTARAKGLTRNGAFWRHAFGNALIPVVTIMGLQFSFLLAGAIIIEQVFVLPGLGRLIFQAIIQRDLIVVKSVIMVLIAAVVFVTFVVDLTYAWIDPRLRRRDR